MKQIHLNIILLAMAQLTGPVEGRAEGTAFAYQGRLQSGGSPANALYEMSFGLYDAATNGNLVGTPVTVAPVPVSNGLFTVTLDFGAAAYLGSARWLEITVNLFGSDMVPTTLSPRQPLTSVPYAIRALSSELGVGNMIEGIDGTISGGVSNKIQISSVWGTIGGGNLNVVSGVGGTVAGGRENQSVGFAATISGGWLNSATNNASVGGGVGNRANGFYSAIGGGEDNETGNSGSVVAGGSAHAALGVFSSIGGGYHNRISRNSDGATIGGGFYNEANSELVTIGGGSGNQIQTNSASAMIGGGSANNIGPGAFKSTIGGGGENEVQLDAFYSVIGGGFENLIRPKAIASTIAGGFHNQIKTNAAHASIGGGQWNLIETSGTNATISGGSGNVAQGANSTVGGGSGNTASGQIATVSGGSHNTASGWWGMVPGGVENVAGGNFSFAAGRAAQAVHSGAFVWADGSETNYFSVPFSSTTSNQFSVRATGGVRLVSAIDTNGSTTAGVTLAAGSGAWASLSDRNAKQNFTPANARAILDKVAILPISAWNYKTQDKSIRHLGPTAQDFHAAFGLGESERTITTVDADGVALAAIQGLNQKLEEKNARIKDLEQRLERLEQLMQQKNGGAK
jgi:hypothetical protein